MREKKEWIEVLLANRRTEGKEEEDTERCSGRKKKEQGGQREIDE